MKIYLCAQVDMRPHLRLIAIMLRELGHEVCSRWIDSEEEDCIMSDAQKADVAEDNLMDLIAADAVVAFSGQGPGAARGGRHFELGYAAGRLMPAFFVGKKEHLFHSFRGITCVTDISELLLSLMAFRS